MSCDYQGHVRVEDAASEPKLRCIYCGSWFDSEEDESEE